MIQWYNNDHQISITNSVYHYLNTWSLTQSTLHLYCPVDNNKFLNKVHISGRDWFRYLLTKVFLSDRPLLAGTHQGLFSIYGWARSQPMRDVTYMAQDIGFLQNWLMTIACFQFPTLIHQIFSCNPLSTFNHQGPFYWCRLTLIPAWIRNHMPS